LKKRRTDSWQERTSTPSVSENGTSSFGDDSKKRRVKGDRKGRGGKKVVSIGLGYFSMTLGGEKGEGRQNNLGWEKGGGGENISNQRGKKLASAGGEKEKHYLLIYKKANP